MNLDLDSDGWEEILLDEDRLTPPKDLELQTKEWLIDAVKTSDYSTVEALIEGGVRTFLFDKKGDSLLHCAAANNDTRMIEILINSEDGSALLSALNRNEKTATEQYGLPIRHSIDEKILQSNDGKTLGLKLHEAIHARDYKRFIKYVKANRALEIMDEKRRTPLFLAVEGNLTQCVIDLLQAGANPNACGLGNVTPLHVAAINKNLALVKLLIDAGAQRDSQDYTYHTPLTRALANTQDVTPFARLLSKKVKANKKAVSLECTSTSQAPTPSLVIDSPENFTEAIAEDNIGAIEHFLKTTFFDVSTMKNNKDQTLLHVAVRIGATERIIDLLVNAGVPVCTLDIYGKSPLDYAYDMSNKKVHELLLEKINEWKQKKPQAALSPHSASFERAAVAYIPEAKTLPETKKPQINFKDIPLETVVAYLQQGANPNEYVPGIGSPLELAVLDNRIDIVMVLLEAGADIDASNDLGQTPLFLAAKTKNEKMVKFLTRKKAQCSRADNYGNTPLHEAVKIGSLKSVKYLLTASAKISVKNNDGLTPMDIALDGTDLDIVEELLKFGAQFTPHNFSQLYNQAVRTNDVDLLLELFDKNMTCNESYHNAIIALAIREKSEDLQLCLIEKNIHPTEPEKSGLIDLALNIGNEFMVNFLLGNL